MEGSSEVKLPGVWTHEKHRQEEAQTGRKSEERRSKREKVRREKVRGRKSEERK